jgi:antitoxin ParD1/3/4
MPTRNINLTDYFDRFIAENVESGRYKNASEVVRDALRELEQRQRRHAQKRGRLRDAVQAGIDAAERGDYVELNEDEIGPYLAELGREAAKEAKRPKKRKR